MHPKLLYSIVFTVLGCLFAASYCAIGQTVWWHLVSYTPPPEENLSIEEWGERLAKTQKSIEGGLSGHRITFLGMLIEEKHSWGDLRPTEYQGIPGGTTTFIALGGLVGLMLYWVIVLFRQVKRTSSTHAESPVTV
ncbi:MAG TPA: hypothetical protein PLN21_18145 [Gemmatales bacterium]|nr:hypothetical protein [Gemmatales bacterium]